VNNWTTQVSRVVRNMIRRRNKIKEGLYENNNRKFGKWRF